MATSRNDAVLSPLKTANQMLCYTNNDLYFIGTSRLSVPESELALAHENTPAHDMALPFGHLAHADDQADLWVFTVENRHTREVLGKLTAEVKNDQISAIHNLIVHNKTQGHGQAIVESILASNNGSVKIVGASFTSKPFWEKMGVGPMDIYNNCAVHWSEYENHQSARNTVNAKLNDEAIQRDLPTRGRVSRQAPGDHGSDARRAGRSVRDQGRAARVDEELNPSELEWLNRYSYGSTATEGQTFYQFAGFRANTANRTALEAAKQFRAQGKPVDAIRKKTGWFLGEDQQWRFEISDHNAQILIGEFQHDTFENRALLSYTGTLGEILDHHTLYAAYPFLNYLDITAYVDPKSEMSGLYIPLNSRTDPITNAQIHVSAPDVETLREALMHEIQHAIQVQEQFALGPNHLHLSKTFLEAAATRVRALEDRVDVINAAPDSTPLMLRERSAIQRELEAIQNATAAIKEGHMAPMMFERYQALAGEREANLTLDRADMNVDDRYNHPPFVPSGELQPIVIFQNTPVAEIVSQLQLPARANITLFPQKSIIRLTNLADRTSFFHEAAHLFLDLEARQARNNTPTPFQQTILNWLEVDSFDDIGHKQTEQFAVGFEQYLREGNTSNPKLAGVFETVKSWFKNVYANLTQLGTPINDTAREIFDTILTPTQPDPANIAQAKKHEMALRDQLVSTGLYSLRDANTTAAVIGAYALAKTERDDNLPTVDRVFDAMNIDVVATDSIDMDEGIQYDFDTFSIHELVDEQRMIDNRNRQWLKSLDLSTLGETLERDAQQTHSQSLSMH